MADPILDFRTAEQFYQQALKLAQTYTPEWSAYWPAVLTAATPDPVGAAQAVNQDPGLVLLNLFAQLAAYTAGIENQMPNQRRQAFFQSMGMQLRPPLAAQAPLQFMLKPEQPAKAVPAQTAVLDADAQLNRFQTNQDLLVVPATLCAAMTIMPAQDQYIDAMPALASSAASTQGVPLFVADETADPAEQALGHWFIMGDSQLFKPDPALQSITITLYGKQLYSDYFGQWFDGALTPLSAQLTQSADAQRLEIQLSQKPQAAALTIAQVQQEIYRQEDPGAGFTDDVLLTEPDQQPEYWLLVKPSPQVKVLASLAQQLPVVTGIQCTFKGDAIQPQQAAFNVVLLDISNGAYPFGQSPQVGDAFYIRSDSVFSRKGALINISFQLTAVAVEYPVTLYWQFWDGKQWQSFNQTLAQASQYQFVDSTSNLQHDNPDGPTRIQFQCPALGETTVAGGAGLWIRAVIAAGGYGEAGGFTTTSVADTIDSIPATILTPEQKNSVIAYLNNVEGVNFSYQFNQSQFYPPYIQSLQIGYSYAAPPTRYWSYNAFTMSRFLFSPFKPVEEVLTGFYFAFGTADFGNYTLGNKLTLYFYLQQESAAPGGSLQWDYYDGQAWQALSVDDGSYGLSRSGIVSFTVPASMPASYLYSQTAYWFRINNPHVDRTIRVYGIYPNTVMASNITSVEDEVLGSSNEQPSQSFTLDYTPALPNLELQVIEARGLDTVAQNDAAQDSAGGTTAATAGSEVSRQWLQVDNFTFCGPTDRVYTLDCQNGLVTFGDGYNGMIPPRGYNNIIAARYDYTQGLAGNVGAHRLTMLRPGISNIDGVDNPAPAAGGVDGDTVADIAAHSPALVKAGGYAVELSELSALAAQSCQQVAQARALETPQQDISIVLLALSSAPVPYTSPEILNQVAAAIKQVCLAPLAPRISTRAPDFVAINVTAQLAVSCAPDQKNALQQNIGRQLQAFFQPVFGGPGQQGWRFGQTVQASAVSRFLRTLPQVETVLGLNLNGHLNGNIALLPAQLPVAGQMTLLLYLE
ncbi:baseplate J/gp47 family protein [Collimonas fungivorans]|uniref:Uncharacterized protein n=1 Tax=Collimonas fungivorans (strain Ter331) TaxID=1005048 RepID=G0ABR9_COLFT|nr:baseplate J/gp47 family protein [Collimonas fungivorans]AEK61875.1 hypothetical protein CFU_2045 [Collimonas fungivorans Ter331]